MKLVVAALAALMALAAAQEKAPEQDKPRKRQMEERVWTEGRIVCIGCTLAKEHGVDAQCTLHSRHTLGFLDGEGRIWTVVDNMRGHPMTRNQKLRDQKIRVYGWQYSKHQYLELWRYALPDDDEWVDWDFCKTCGWEEGDHLGKDFCPNCLDN